MNLKILLRICSSFMNGIQILFILFARRAYIFVRGPLIYTLNCKKVQRKRDNIHKTATSDNVGNEWILHLNVRSIDFHFEELETLIQSFRVNKPSLVCCSETWMTELSAENFYALDNYAPLKFQPGETRNEGVAIYVHESLLLSQ